MDVFAVCMTMCCCKVDEIQKTLLVYVVQAWSPNWMSMGEWIPSGIIGSLQGWGHLRISDCRDLSCALYNVIVVVGGILFF